eukprot:ctg_1427.g459
MAIPTPALRPPESPPPPGPVSTCPTPPPPAPKLARRQVRGGTLRHNDELRAILQKYRVDAGTVWCRLELALRAYLLKSISLADLLLDELEPERVYVVLDPRDQEHPVVELRLQLRRPGVPQGLGNRPAVCVSPTDSRQRSVDVGVPGAPRPARHQPLPAGGVRPQGRPGRQHLNRSVAARDASVSPPQEDRGDRPGRGPRPLLRQRRPVLAVSPGATLVRHQALQAPAQSVVRQAGRGADAFWRRGHGRVSRPRQPAGQSQAVARPVCAPRLRHIPRQRGVHHEDVFGVLPRRDQAPHDAQGPAVWQGALGVASAAVSESASESDIAPR